MDYWKECISEAFEDAGITVTEEQIGIVTSWVEGAHENYGLASGYDTIPNPENTEIKELKRLLKEERERIRDLTYSNDRLRWKIWELKEKENSEHEARDADCPKCHNTGIIPGGVTPDGIEMDREFCDCPKGEEEYESYSEMAHPAFNEDPNNV